MGNVTKNAQVPYLKKRNLLPTLLSAWFSSHAEETKNVQKKGRPGTVIIELA